jgi:hypothetical protein
MHRLCLIPASLIIVAGTLCAQSVVLSPTGSQDIVQPVSGSATTQFSANNIAGRRYAVAAYNWSQTDVSGSIGNLSSPGSGKQLTLSPCPVGIDISNNANAQYDIYISGTGTPEAAPVTGGGTSPCTSGAASGTIVVTTVNSHAAGFTVGSANSGIQEAINDAAALTSNGPRAVINLSPTAGATTANYTVFSTIYLKPSKSLISGYGALLQCSTRAACLIVGNYLGGASFSTVEGLEFVPSLNVDGVQISSVAASSGLYTITTVSAHPFVTGDYVIMFYSNGSQTQEGRFQVNTGTACSPSCSTTQFQYMVGTSTFSSASSYGWANIENAAIEDISDHLTVRNIKFSAGSGSQFFSWGIVIGNDQSFKIDGVSNEGSSQVIQCSSANFCGALIYARGDQGAAPVVDIDHAEISMQCGGNGIRYASGNTLHVTNSVVQGFAQYGIYYAGGLQNMLVGGVYQESGNCTNPFYPTLAGGSGASAGIITNSDLTYLGDDPIGGQLPSFPAANAGAQQNNYYVVIHSANFGVLGMFFVGSCLTTGTGNCTTYWPEPDLDGLGSVTYDVLVTTGTTAIPPNGTGSYSPSSSTGLTGSCNTAGVCSYVDPQTGTSSYAVPAAAGVARLNFWPGAFVLGSAARLHINNCGQASSIVATSYLPSIFCNHGIFGTSAQRAPYWADYMDGDSSGNGNSAVGAVLKQSGPASGAAASGLTGLYGFLNTGSLGQTDMITLAYTSPFLALATPGYRPTASSTDTAIGLDNTAASTPASAQLAFRAPSDVSFYINHTFDNTSFLERLTSTAKTFKVPVTLSGAGNTGALKAARYMGGGSAPTCSFTSGGGTSPLCTLDTGSSDTAGIIIAGTGTGAPAGTGSITLTFSATFGTNKPVCIYEASDGGTGTWNGLAVMKDKTASTSSDLFTWTNGTTPTALSASTAYRINYLCFAK